MPPQQPDSGFTPDDDGFTPDAGFTPDPTEPIPSKGKWVTKGMVTQWVADKPVDISKRPDTVMIGGVSEMFDKARERMVDAISGLPINESSKPQFARLASLAMEVPRVIAESFSTPEGILLPSILKPLAPRASKLPGMIKGTQPIRIVPGPKTMPPLQRALPPGDLTDPNIPRRSFNDPYIATETGQVQRESLLTPQEEARLAGYEVGPEGPVPARATQPAHYPVDLAELRERERLARLTYTGHEQAGGTSLTLPDRPNMGIPPQAGDVKLGFEPVSRGPLGYPLNIVPEAVRPRSVQTVTRALAGDEMAAPLAPREPVGFVSAPKPKPEVPSVEVKPIPGSLPSAPPKPPRTPGKIAEAAKAKAEAEAAVKVETAKAEATKTAKGNKTEIRIKNPNQEAINALKTAGYTIVGRAKDGTVIARSNAQTTTSGLNIPEAITTPPGTPPEVKSAVEKGVQTLAKESELPSIFTKSLSTQMESLGPAGREIMWKFRRVAQERAQYDAAWTETLNDVGHPLSKAEKANFGAYVEGRTKIPNERVQRAVDEYNRGQNLIGDTATAEKLQVKRGEEMVDFQKIKEGYWPRIPVESLTKESIIDRLVKNGMSRYDAIKVARRWENTGQILVGPQHSRMEKLFEYRDDFDAAIQHGRTMAGRIAKHKNLGPLDVAGKGEQGIADLIEATTDPKLALKLAQRLVGRDELPSAKLMAGLNTTKQAISITALPEFTFKNLVLGQLTNAHMAIMSRHPVKAAAEVLKLFKSSYRDEMRAAGVFNRFNRTLMEDLAGVDPWQIGAGEKINRAIAGAIGKSAIRTALEDYKAGVNTKGARYFIETLLARDPDSIQAITPELETFAAGRMAEITQGLNNPANLPYGWSNPVNTYGNFAGQLLLIFKKVGFQTTKTIKDSITQSGNPALAATSWLALTQVAGEMLGDIKTVYTGKERPEDWTRIFSNWGNAFTLGMPWELLTSARYGPLALAGYAAGPIITKGSQLANASWRTGERLVEGEEDPFGPIRQFGIQNLPLPFRERIFGEEE